LVLDRCELAQRDTLVLPARLLQLERVPVQPLQFRFQLPFVPLLHLACDPARYGQLLHRLAGPGRFGRARRLAAWPVFKLNWTH